MSDIVERLRAWSERTERATAAPHRLCDEAADEIERLRHSRADENGWAISLLVQKQTEGSIVTSCVQSVRWGMTKDQAVGEAVLFAAKEKPGFGIIDILVQPLRAEEPTP